MRGVAGVHKGMAGVQEMPSETEFLRSPFCVIVFGLLVIIDLFLVALLSLLFVFAY